MPPASPWNKNAGPTAEQQPAGPAVPAPNPWNKNAGPAAEKNPASPAVLPASPWNKNPVPVADQKPASLTSVPIDPTQTPAATDGSPGPDASLSPPKAWGPKNKASAGAAAETTRSASPKPAPINTNVSGASSKPSKFAAMLAKVKSSGGASENKTDQASNESSPIPGAWNGVAMPQSAGGSSKSGQPSELAVVAAGAKNMTAADLADTDKPDEDAWLLD